MDSHGLIKPGDSVRAGSHFGTVLSRDNDTGLLKVGWQGVGPGTPSCTIHENQVVRNG